MDLSESIKTYLRTNPSSSARNIATDLGVDKTLVNAVLYRDVTFSKTSPANKPNVILWNVATHNEPIVNNSLDSLLERMIRLESNMDKLERRLNELDSCSPDLGGE